MKNFLKIILPLMLVLAAACQEFGKHNEARVRRMINQIREHYVPDSRTGIFEIQLEQRTGMWLISGATDHPEAINALLDSLERLGISYRNEIETLPSPGLAGKNFGLVRVSVANIRSGPSHSSEMSTQVLLGMKVKLLQKKRGWYRVQSLDGYIGWLNEDSLTPFDQDTYNQYRAEDKIIYTALWGLAYSEADEDSRHVSDLVTGCVLEYAGSQGDFYKVKYPDGRMAYVLMSESEPFTRWNDQRDPNPENLVLASMQFMGLPYLWGGTSSKGVDCSGFTKMIYFLNGIVLPRDASQQARVGMLVDEKKYFNRLMPGDLLFFGSAPTDSTRERVVHTGMWIGNMKFIHASGDVHISSMDRDDPAFDSYNLGRYLKSRRILNSQYMDQLNIFNFY